MNTNNDSKNYTFIADSSAEDERLDVFLTDQFDSLSRSYIQKLTKEGHILVNGAVLRNAVIPFGKMMK